MRRTLALGAVWVVAAALAAGVAWTGIGVVGDQVTDERPAPLSADEVAQAVEAGSTGTTTASAPGGPTTTAPAVAATTRTISTIGGVVTLRFTPSGVAVAAATPNQGFEVDWEPEHGNGVKVEFESDTHESRVDAWWDGAPQSRVRENGEDVGDDDSGVEDAGDDDSGPR